MATDRDFRTVYTDGCRVIKFYNNSGGTIKEGQGFNIQSGTVTALANNNTAGLFGIACADVADGEYGSCWIEGVFSVAVAGTLDFAQGEAVYTASSSTVDKGSSSDVPIGHVVSEDPASGASRVEIAIVSQLLDRTAHA